MMVLTARPGVEPSTLETALFDQLGALRTRPVSAERLEVALNRILTDLFQDLQRLDQRADLFSQVTTYFDEPERALGEPDRYASITPEDLHAYVEAFGVPENRALVVVKPRESP